MRSLQLIPENLVSRLTDKVPEQHFYLLGSADIRESPLLTEAIQNKLTKESLEPVSELWGTLGFSDGKRRDWIGELDFSENGNMQFSGVVKSEVGLIKKSFNLKTGHRIIERFISFDRTRITPGQNEKPVFRLTLMTETDESALVFFQHKDSQTGKEYIEYVLPQATTEHNTDRRDRLHYLFTAPENYYTSEEMHQKDRFLIKIISFKRNFWKNSYFFLQKLEDSFLKKQISKKTGLLIFNKIKEDFEACKSVMIDADRKTLFLIHGTFTDTEGSFGCLYKKKNSWLKNRFIEFGGKYEQIIAFNHPTVIAGAKENIETLFELLEGDFKFSSPVDIIATSQGGLLAQYLANMDQLYTKIPVGKAALIASANGVDYFTAGANISKFLSVMKYIFNASGKKEAALIVGLASQSVDFLLKQPGFRLMTPGNDTLTQIMNSEPSSKDTIYYPIIDDFDKFSIVDKKALKPLLRTLSLLITPILGKYNDLVVKTENQFIVPQDYCCISDYSPDRYLEYKHSALHGKAIELEQVQNQVSFFLEQGQCL